MYFFTLFSFLLVFFINSYEKEYPKLLYFKIFLVSFLFFYYIMINNGLIINLLLSLLFFSLLIYFIFKYLKNNIKVKEEDNLLFQVAHEVKNPLAVCKGYLDMLDINDKDKLEKYIPIIKSEMNRSLNIMDEFLSLKKISLNKELMDLSLLLDDINETIKLGFDDNSINLDIPHLDREILINGDYDKLKQVLINLIKNAYEAGAKNIRLKIKYNNNCLKIDVIDDGKGISKDDLTKVGNLFYTTKVDGTGIGVSLSKEIIKLHDGTLSYNSKINRGTTASLVLPLEYLI